MDKRIWTGMQLSEVTQILTDLRAAGCRVWVAGGWGVDALVGYQTRSHRDLDLAIDATAQSDETSAIRVLKHRGYQVETDWHPVRVELVNAGRGWVDLHPVVFDHAGYGRQADRDGGQFDYPPDAFGVGVLDETELPCLSREQQVAFHTGYEPRAVDLHDRRLLSSLCLRWPRVNLVRRLPAAELVALDDPSVRESSREGSCVPIVVSRLNSFLYAAAKLSCLI